MKWIVEDILRAVEQLRHWQTWVVIGLIALFAGLAFLIGSYAFRTDAVVVFMHHTVRACQTLSNGGIIAMLCCMIFFFFTAVLTLGEFQRHLDFKRHHAHRDSRHALIWSVTWGFVTVGIAVGALYFFTHYCQ